MTKQVEAEVEIDADAARVWRALTEGEELKRWFTLDARVTPGEGGAIWQSFGEGMDWETPIEVWEPNRHLRAGDAATKIAVDYFIETRGGKTVLRLVHSGFADDTWEGELDNLDAGWASFLRLLKLYLERHDDEPRTMVSFRHPPVELPRDEIFRRALAMLGVEGTPRVGERYTTSTGFEGVVEVFKPPINFSGTVANLGDAFLMLEIEQGKERCRPALWVSLFGDRQSEAPAMQERITKMLEDAF